MDKKRTKSKETRVGRGSARGVSPPASRTRSKSPARVEISGKDSAPIRRGRNKKTDTPPEEVSSSSQSSTPKKEAKKPKKIPVVVDDSEDNEEVVSINTRSSRLASLRKRLSPVDYKNTPTPSEDQKRSVSRSASSLYKEDSQDEGEIEVSPSRLKLDSLSVLSKPVVVFFLLEAMIILPVVLQINFKGPWVRSKVYADLLTSATYCNKQAGSFFIAFLSGTVLLALGPIGRVVKLPGSDQQYKFSGIVTAIVILAFLVGLELNGLDSLTAIYNNIDRFLFLSIFSNLVTAVALYIRGKRQPPANPNPQANSGKFIVDFAAGKEINPKIFNRLDVKSVAYQRSIILILIINIALLFKNITVPVVEGISEAPIGELIKDSFNNLVFIVRNSEYNCASLVISGLLVLYSLDALIFEHHLAVSFQSNEEGCGAELLLRFATFPFLLSFLPRFLLAQKLDINRYLLAGIAIVFIVSLGIKRLSSRLKYEYRVRPSDAKFKGRNFTLTRDIYLCIFFTLFSF
jgi:Ergosterol biosynthesis ERG4/ERG24 family